MKKLFLLSFGVIVVLAAGIYAFYHIPDDAFLESIPQDAPAIVRLNCSKLFEKAHLNKDEQRRALSRLHLLTVGTPSEEFFPNRLGVDFYSSIYGFVSSSGDFGLVAKVSDRDALQECLSSLVSRGKVSELTNQRGFSWAVMDHQWLLAFNSSKLLLMGPSVGSDQNILRNEMVRLLKQGTKESGKNSPLFTQLVKSDEPLVGVLSPDLLPTEARGILAKIGVKSAEDALLCLTLEPDENEIEIKAVLLTDKPEVRQCLKDVERSLRPLKADLLDYVHSDAVAWISCNVRGDDVLPFLRRVEPLRLALVTINLAVDADLIIRSIDGDVALELSNSTPASMQGKDLPEVQFMARLSDTDFLNHSTSWGSQSLMPLHTISPSDFAINIGRKPFYFGTLDKVFYLGTMPLSFKRKMTNSPAFFHDYRNEIRGLRLFATADVRSLLTSLGISDESPFHCAQHFERLTLEMEQVGKLKIELTAPKGTDIFKECFLGDSN